MILEIQAVVDRMRNCIVCMGKLMQVLLNPVRTRRTIDHYCNTYKYR